MMKKRFATLLVLLAMAVLLCPAVAFAIDGDLQAAPLQVQNDGGGEGENGGLPASLSDGGYQFYFKASGGAWVHKSWAKYCVNDAQDSIEPDVKLYYNGSEVDASKYDLKWQLTWYDEELDRGVFQDATTPLRMQVTGEGDNQEIKATYAVSAVAKDGSGLSGESDFATVTLVDKHSFDAHCKDFSITGGFVDDSIVPGWHDHFAIATAAASTAGIVVCDGALNSDNTPIGAQNYTITYYRRAPGPYNLDDQQWYEKTFAQTDANRLGDAFPTTAGTYFAVVTGVESYFGSTMIDFDVIDNYLHTEIVLNPSGRDKPLFSDGSVEIGVSTEGSQGAEGTDWEVRVAAGKLGTFVDATRTFAEPLPEGACVYDSAARKITIDGSKIEEGDFDREAGIVVRAWVEGKSAQRVLSESRFDCYYKETKAEYDFNDLNDRDMLPNWRESVDKTFNVYVEDSQHPDGQDLECDVRQVATSDASVVAIEKKFDNDDETSEDYWWEYEALKYGEATITVTYADPTKPAGQQTQTREFKVHVKPDVYRVSVGAEDGSTMALPGRSIVLVADGAHDCDYDVDEGQEEPLTYQWSLDAEGNQLARIVPDPDDPSRATVTFKGLGEGVEDIWENVRATVTLYGQDGSGSEVERASKDIWLVVASEYTELWPAFVDPQLDLGACQDVCAEVRHYSLGNDNDYVCVENASFQWEYDDQKVQVLDESGVAVEPNRWIAGTHVPFTVKRLARDDTNVKLAATWREDNRDEYRMCDFFLDEKNYDIWFEDDRFVVFDDWHTTLDLNTSRLEGLTGYDLVYEVGYWEEKPGWNEGSGQDWDAYHEWKPLPDDSGVLVVNDGVATVVGDKVAERNLGGVNVRAVVKYGNEELSRDECWVELARSCANGSHAWFERVDSAPTCDRPGSKTLECNPCGEERRLEMPSLGHAWNAPTYSWSADNSTCTAMRVCANDASHRQVETVRTNSSVSHAATQTTMGQTTYTAMFRNTAFTMQKKTVANIPKLPATTPVAAAPGTAIASGADSYIVTAAGAAPEVAFARGGTAKSINVPATIQSGGVTYAVAAILKSAGKGKKKLKSFTIGENVVSIDAKTCKDAKKLTKVTVKSGKLTKKAIKNLLKGSKIKTIKLSGPAAKAMKKQYQKWAGKKAKVK